MVNEEATGPGVELGGWDQDAAQSALQWGVRPRTEKDPPARGPRRQAIRESWGRETNVGNQTVVRVFLLGKTPPEDNHPDLSDMLKFESEKHQDILMWNYRDTFFNLSLKEVLFLRWSNLQPARIQVQIQERRDTIQRRTRLGLQSGIQDRKRSRTRRRRGSHGQMKAVTHEALLYPGAGVTFS
ncbi:hypothetical protein A6R68_18810 [Neotoma lepida]|uniref:Hexosyltransferase n=1 Tax=Neotoma lepida TaxID=56216 RepID=A0A1A6HKI2_NEOLE|nr:hypothetical protein A6R68_18810 [Neotoma lepida]